MDTQFAVQTNHLVKCFGGTEVIKSGTMTVERGTIYGFLGANGAGKTTMFKLLTGLLTPESGSISILGADMLRQRDSMLSKIGSMIESPVFYEHLSARKNLEIHLAYMGVTGIGIEPALKLVGLSDPGEKEVAKFSMGMRQRLGIARALIHQPQILILDEPVNGLDPMGIREMRKLFVELVQKYRMTILLSSHILSEVEQVADKIGVIAKGRVIKEINLKQLKAENNGSLEDYFFRLMEGRELSC